MLWPSKSSKQRWLLGLGLITCISGYFGALSYYSFDISSDDALYFQRALSHFSVLEFSPHFPGYPGFVWLERLLQGVSGHANSNVLLSFISAIALSLSVFVYCYRRIETKAFALFAVLLFLVQGNLAELAFNGLSDATALLFLSLYLFTQADKSSTSTTTNGLISGLLLAACLATRPSYLPLVVSALALAFFTQRNLTQSNWISPAWARLGWQLASISIVGLICAGYIFIHDGWAYFDEARRFTQGHFTIWGNTGDQHDPVYLQWLNALLRTYSAPGLVMLTASLLVGLYIRHTRQLSILACCWLAWILCGQNPENIRHLAVLSLLLPIIFSLLAAHFFQRRRTLVIVSMLSIVCTLGYHSMDKFSHNKHAPSEQAIHFFQTITTMPLQSQQTIISNYNVATLRDSLPQHVILDRHYQSSSAYLAKQGDYWQLSSTLLTQQQPLKKFNGRFLGERPLYLYYYSATTTARLSGSNTI